MRLKHFFTITAIIVVCGCGISDKDIMRYGREGNVDLLVRTIDKGYQKQKRHAKVKLAIEQIVKQDDEKAWNYLLYRFDHGFTDDLISHTLLAPSSTSNLNGLRKQFLEHIKESDYTSAQALMSIAAGVGIADEQIPHTIQEQLQVTINAKTRLDSLNELQDFAIRSISDCQDQTEKAHKIQEKYFQLGGYIAVKEDISNFMFGVIGRYQIILNSGSRAILQTTETRFDSWGTQFTLWVYEWGEQLMTSGKDRGGFTKTEQWKVYREATSDRVREMHLAMDIISASEESIEFSKEVIDLLEPLLSSQNEAFHAAQSRLIRLLEETFGYSNVSVN